MNGKKRNGTCWAVEFDGDRVRLCGFTVQDERAFVKHCEVVPAEEFKFHEMCGDSSGQNGGEVKILCAVPRSEVFLKPFAFPRTEGVDIRRIAALKLEQSVADLDPSTTLWGMSEERLPGESRKVRVLAATIARRYVDEMLDAHFADERPGLVECGALAAARAHLAGRAEPAACELLVDCSADGLSVFVLRHGVVDVAHFVPADRPLRIALSQIRRVILALSGDASDSPIEAVTCMGGGQAKELAAALQPTLDIPVRDRIESVPGIVDGGAGLPPDWTQNWHRVIGLILSVTGDRFSPINLLAVKKPRRHVSLAIPGIEGIRTSVLVVTLLALVVGAFVVKRFISNRREVLMSKVIAVGREVTSDLESQEKAVQRLKAYKARRFSLFRVLAELHELAPPGITLDNLTINPDGSMSVTARGKKLSEGQEFASKLNESEFFESAETPSQRRDGKQAVFKTTFKLTSLARRAKQ